MAEKQTKNQMKRRIHSGMEFAADEKSGTGAGARFFCKTPISGSSNAELEGLVEL